jgi:aminobenzoyl-glutamate utilization protein B
MVTACAGGTHGRKTVEAASRVMAATALDFILDPQLLAEARAEHAKRLNGRVYRRILPEGTPIPLTINKDIMGKYRA